MALRQKHALDTITSMIEKLQEGWNRYGIIGSQIALMAVLFLYGFASFSGPWVLSFVVAVILAATHHQWVQAALYPLVDDATNRGNFKVLARLAWLHQDFVVFGSAVLIGVYAVVVWWLNDIDSLLLGSVIIALAGMNASWKATLRFHKTTIVIQAVGLRRVILILGGIIGWFLMAEIWLSTFVFLVVITGLSVSALRLLVGHLESYKEHRYRRSYEDSGIKESYVSLAARVGQAYLHSLSTLYLPVLILLSTALVYRYVEVSARGLERPTTFVLLGLVVFANQQVVSLLPANEDWRTAYNTQNLSLVRDRLALLLERLLYRSHLMATVILALIIGLGIVTEVWYLGLVYFAIVVVLMLLQVYLLERQVAYLRTPRSTGWIHFIALVIYLSNGWLLSIYYPDLALALSFGLLLGWWFIATMVEWTQSFGFEWRIHVRQSSKIIGIFLLAMLANGLVLFVLQQVPLGVDPLIEGLLLAALFVIITSVIVYSMNAILGLNSMVRSLRVFLQETKESILSYEEEVSLW